MLTTTKTYSRYAFGAALLGYALMSASFATHWHELSFLAAVEIDAPHEHGGSHHGVPFVPHEAGECDFAIVYAAHHNAPPSDPPIVAPVFRVLGALVERPIVASPRVDVSREQSRAPPAA